MHSTRTTCRACGSKGLVPLFSLGEQCVSDFVASKDATVNRVPIDIVQCIECTLVQQKHTAPSDFMYTRHYWYKSGTTETMRTHLSQLAEVCHQWVRDGDNILDIGSNDGTFLRALKELGNRTFQIGVEPATNLVEEGRRGLDLLIHDFWSIGALQAAGHGDTKFKVVTALGMFYDLEDPNQFIRDIAHVLHKDGVFIAQLMCARNMFALRDVGNLCHEHLEFYTLRSLDILFGKYGLEIFDIETNTCNGESYRLFVRHKCFYVPDAGYKRVLSARCAEQELLQLHETGSWKDWFMGCEFQRDRCVEFVRGCNKQVWVYGASTKGNVILQWYGLDGTAIAGAIDKDHTKLRRYTVGSNIEIRPEGVGRRNADYFLVLPYAFFDEFKVREADWLSRGGKFLVPLPTFKVV